ncbi:MAG: hypothetical protein AAF689_01000 [Pseudomonadota bacterium]
MHFHNLDRAQKKRIRAYVPAVQFDARGLISASDGGMDQVVSDLACAHMT